MLYHFSQYLIGFSFNCFMLKKMAKTFFLRCIHNLSTIGLFNAAQLNKKVRSLCILVYFCRNNQYFLLKVIIVSMSATNECVLSQ